MREHYQQAPQRSAVADYVFSACIGLFFACFLFFFL
jgi:hypothetical protein